MRISAKSRQYANLLLKIAEQKQALEQVYRSMEAFYAVYRRDAVLKAFLTSRKVSNSDKIGLLAKVYPDLHPINQAFLAQLGEERDMKLLSSIVKYLETAFYQRSGQVKVHAVSTAALSGKAEAEIKRVVQSVTSKTADFSTEVNPSILGGLTLRVGNTMLDASLSSKLARVRHSLIKS